MTETSDPHETAGHASLDTLLGATPRRVLRHWLSLLILAAALLGAAVFFVRFVTGDDSPYYSAPVERGDLVPQVSERGLIHGSGEVTIHAPVEGPVTWLTPDDTVDRGALVAKIDVEPIRAAVAIDESRLAAAQASLEAAQVSAREAAGRLARFESVWRRSGGRAPSLNELEGARSEARRTELAVATAQAQRDAARLQLRGNEARVKQAEIRAPISGMVVSRAVRPGQAVSKGQAVLVMAAGASPLTIRVPMPVDPASSITLGAPARVRLDSLPDQPQTAKLSGIIPMRPGSTGRPGAVFTLASPSPGVRPGMTATVEVDLARRENVLLVPDAALAFDPAGAGDRKRRRIYLLTKDGEPRRVYVTAGASDGSRTEVFAEELEPGMQVITGWRDAASGKQARDR